MPTACLTNTETGYRHQLTLQKSFQSSQTFGGVSRKSGYNWVSSSRDLALRCRARGPCPFSLFMVAVKFSTYRWLTHCNSFQNDATENWAVDFSNPLHFQIVNSVEVYSQEHKFYRRSFAGKFQDVVWNGRISDRCHYVMSVWFSLCRQIGQC